MTLQDRVQCVRPDDLQNRGNNYRSFSAVINGDVMKSCGKQRII